MSHLTESGDIVARERYSKNAFGTKGPVAANITVRPIRWSPEPDDVDGDGVLDDTDACLGESETLNGKDDTDGCTDAVAWPVPGEARVEVEVERRHTYDFDVVPLDGRWRVVEHDQNAETNRCENL